MLCFKKKLPDHFNNLDLCRRFLKNIKLYFILFYGFCLKCRIHISKKCIVQSSSYYLDVCCRFFMLNELKRPWKLFLCVINFFFSLLKENSFGSGLRLNGSESDLSEEEKTGSEYFKVTNLEDLIRPFFSCLLLMKFIHLDFLN